VPKKRKPEELKPGMPRQESIDAFNFVESRKTWNPDPEQMEDELERINREFLNSKKRRSKSA
jgi:hypothetical protein